ncbi:MAG: 3-isopropylmalate dehydratase small subunit [Rhodobacteraceae bacterium]|nr:3-isopropylmalate dehydratase small subunit [Paracoccaceae bacterium]
MSGWQTHNGRAARLMLDNVDTDQLIPARFMSTPRSAGYGDFLLHDLRASGTAVIDPGVSVLIAGRNFGCGSSREAAVYALVDFGIRAVLAPGFGDIFAANAANNGLLCAVTDTAALTTDTTIHIDLAALTIRQGAHTSGFDLDPVWQRKLINGWDDIDLTTRAAGTISDFSAAYAVRHPWTVPRQG